MKRFSVILLCSLFIATTAQAEFVRGDINKDQLVTSKDLALLKQYVSTRNIPEVKCPDKADVNDDGKIDNNDIAYLDTFLNKNGPQPKAPFPKAGHDITDDAFLCGQCVISGSDGTKGWIYSLKPPYNALKQVANDTKLRGLVSVANLDYQNFMALSKPANGGAQLSIVSSKGAVTPLFQGPILGFLGKDPQEITHLEEFGIFGFAEGNDGIVGNQVNILAPFLPGPFAVAKPRLRPKATRFDKNFNMVIASGSARSKGTEIFRFEPTLKTTSICTDPSGEPNDLIIDRVSGDYIFALDRSWPNDQIRGCKAQASSNSFLVIEQLKLDQSNANGSLAIIEQLPSKQFKQDYIVGLQDGGTGRLYQVDRTTQNKRVANLAASAQLNGMNDALCITDE